MTPIHEPKIIDDIKCYAPELAFSNDGFHADAFEKLYEIESENFWFKSRNRIISFLFKKFIGHKPSKILEIGCGTGFVLKELSSIKSYTLLGAEIYLEGLQFAKKRLPKVSFIQLDCRNIPFENEFDGVGAFDVLEHIEEDLAVMHNVYKCLKPGGFFLITVPQHKFMWSYLDEMACHKRRYSRNELVAKLHQAGFIIQYTGSFVFTLFPLMLISRLFKRNINGTESAMSELSLPVFVNRVLEVFMRVDEIAIKAGLSLPFGGSLVLVCNKKTE